MSGIAHPISPEELMAYADGQLEAGRLLEISKHIKDCSECAAAVADANHLSSRLAAWKVEEPSERIAGFVTAELKQKFPDRESRVNVGFWTAGRKWFYGVSGTFAALLLLLTVAIPSLLRSRQAPTEFPNLSFSIEQSPTVPQSQTGATAGPMVVRTVKIALSTKDLDAARTRIDSVVQQSAGYIDQLTVSGEPGSSRRLSATLRLPANQVESALNELKKLGRLSEESQNSSDITAQYIDLTARLSNARNSEQRLLALLRDRTGNLKDVVEVEREISSVRESIERMEAQQKDLNNKVQFATIQLEIAEEYRAQLEPPAPGLGTQLRNALVDGVRSAAENALDITLFLLRYGPVFLIWLIVMGPFALWLWRKRAAQITPNNS